jgi:hypothetical protein
VLRLWHVADGTDESRSRLPIWGGILTTERSRPEWGLIAVTRTLPGAPEPARTLAEIHGERTALETRVDGGQVLLVW